MARHRSARWNIRGRCARDVIANCLEGVIGWIAICLLSKQHFIYSNKHEQIITWINIKFSTNIDVYMEWSVTLVSRSKIQLFASTLLLSYLNFIMVKVEEVKKKMKSLDFKEDLISKAYGKYWVSTGMTLETVLFSRNLFETMNMIELSTLWIRRSQWLNWGELH